MTSRIVQLLSFGFFALTTSAVFAQGVTTAVGNGTLTITGTNGNDSIQVTVNSTDVVVKIVEASTRKFPRNSVRRIVVKLQNGDDQFTAPNCPFSITAYGGAGSDFISGGRGDDDLFGGSGRDVLIGNLGLDLVSGEGGEDVLIGGTATANYVQFIKDVWFNIASDFSTRLDAFNAQIPAVFSDGEANVLTGGSNPESKDLFFLDSAEVEVTTDFFAEVDAFFSNIVPTL